jgi:serine/threonine-protein kinase
VTSGRVLLGDRYRLTGRIAGGGMGEVWRAVDELLGREVAVKLLRQHVAADPEFRQRFRTEARITASLVDPHVAQVFDYGEQPDGAYLVMELVPGEPLSEILARHGTLSPETTLDLISQVARGLAAAHRAGIIHRDIKPGNLLVNEAGQVKITDFGIARATQAAPVTRTGTVLGTAQYVSPEQAMGERLTPSTDIYSLGVVAYECLVGHPPFVADTQVAIALMHLNEPPPPLLGHVPPQVRDLVMAMLAKAPERRPASADELSDRAYWLRESLASGGPADPADLGTDLGTLTNPAGWAVQTGAAASPPDASAAGAGGEEGPQHNPAMLLLLGVAAAAAIGIIVLVFASFRPPESPDIADGGPDVTATSTPQASRTGAKTPRPTLPIAPGKSAKPIPSESATVSKSAGTTPRPSPTPTRTTPTATPTISPTTPKPTPTPTPSATPTPSTSASVSVTPSEET